MKTDTLFYELFQTAPQTFFELLQMTPDCSYQFESITVKASEKRIDGVFTPATAGQPIYFLEVQGFPDDVIYFRTMREVATYLEQRPALKDNEWQATVLWLNKSDDPGFGTLRLLARKPKPRLLTLDLIELLRKLPETSLTLNVLRPLLVNNEREVRENVVQWVTNIRQTPDLDANTEEKLITVMSQLIEQKFRRLTYEEISKMIRLTPLAETISGQGLIKDERVALLTRLIRRKFFLSDELMESITHELKQLDLTALNELVDQILDINTVEELETWIAAHTPAASAVPPEEDGWLDDDLPEEGP
jgi:predicted transposase YdaD